MEVRCERSDFRWDSGISSSSLSSAKASWEDFADVLRLRLDGVACASNEVEDGLWRIMVSRCDIKCIGEGVKRAGKEASTPSSMGEAKGEPIIGVELLRKPRAGGVREDCDVRVLGRGGREEASGLLPLLLREV